MSTPSHEVSAERPPRPHLDAEFVSIVLPAYNERENLGAVIHEVDIAMGEAEHEVVVVDDGSIDGTGDELHRLASRYPNMRVITLMDRRGQSAALVSGVEASRGPVIVTLDADGQNDPSDIPRLLELFRERPRRAVVGYRHRRAASPWKRVQGRFANAMRDIITGDRVRDTGCALRVVWRADFLRVPRFNGVHRFIPTLLKRDGVEVVEVPVHDRPRKHGKSKYGMWNRVFVGLVDALGVRWLRMRRLPGNGV